MRWAADMTELSERASVQLPGLPSLGFAFWFAWNLVAFSGSVWLTQNDSGGSIMYLFVAHLLASVGTLLAINAAMGRFGDLICSRRFLAMGAVLGCSGTWLMILEGGNADCVALFVAGCALAGVGTSFMLVRSGMIFGLVPPRRSKPSASALFSPLLCILLLRAILTLWDRSYSRFYLRSRLCAS